MSLFISGVREVDGNCERVEKDEDAQFFTLYSNKSGPSRPVEDFMSRDCAEKYLSLLEACQRARNQFYAAGYEPKADSMNPTECLLAQLIAAISKATGE
ncbi:hypothetical protein [Dryocola clanedunensis]